MNENHNTYIEWYNSSITRTINTCMHIKDAYGDNLPLYQILSRINLLLDAATDVTYDKGDAKIQGLDTVADAADNDNVTPNIGQGILKLWDLVQENSLPITDARLRRKNLADYIEGNANYRDKLLECLGRLLEPVSNEATTLINHAFKVRQQFFGLLNNMEENHPEFFNAMLDAENASHPVTVLEGLETVITEIINADLARQLPLRLNRTQGLRGDFVKKALEKADKCINDIIVDYGTGRNGLQPVFDNDSFEDWVTLQKEFRPRGQYGNLRNGQCTHTLQQESETLKSMFDYYTQCYVHSNLNPPLNRRGSQEQDGGRNL